MTDWLILVENTSDIDQGETPHKVMRIADYLARPSLFAGRRPYVLNLARSYGYQSSGYYASLLAEARGHRISPSVQTIVELSQKGLYTHAIPDLNARLQEARQKGAPVVESLFVAFSKPDVSGYGKFARELSDWFRTPAIEVEFQPKPPHDIARIKPIPPHKMNGARRHHFLESMAAYTKGRASNPKSRPQFKWSLAILADPTEKMPPSKPAALKRLCDVAEKMGVETEILEPGDLTSLAEFDALFIRATTSIDNFTYKFARRAEQEGMPVIDDTMSMIRCTNKVYLKEILEKAGVPIPKTEVISEKTDLAGVMERLGSPVVLKTPDGSFGANMVKATNLEELKASSSALFKDTALLIAQGFLPTKFDWRIGVLDGEPLFACQYRMARGHWQIVKRGTDGKITEGGSATMAISDAPALVVETAVRAARLIGDGLYGVDLKETEDGVFVIEINDNPNLEIDIEAAVLKDELWRKIIAWFAARLERRMGR
ncbi:RimK-like ATPgrasp N-terminal domain-containing protein [Rhizobium sp. L1K21]|uniref:RimK family protein n=1 Tax=Rhizobium sp. L1K21 TaxID=2954933 RepID=UPI002093945C|nr:RimK family protein [Rhizobium sp. L1K21]